MSDTPIFEWQCKGCALLGSACGTCPKCEFYGWKKKPVVAVIPKAVIGVFYETKDRMPTPGDRIVKQWKNGAIWAGTYSGSHKDVSFDSWLLLPRKNNLCQ